MSDQRSELPAVLQAIEKAIVPPSSPVNGFVEGGYVPPKLPVQPVGQSVSQPTAAVTTSQPPQPTQRK